MPVHLASIPMSLHTAVDEPGGLRDVDVACLNDPFRGGTRLPDTMLISLPLAAGTGDVISMRSPGGWGVPKH